MNVTTETNKPADDVKDPITTGTDKPADDVKEPLGKPSGKFKSNMFKRLLFVKY